MNFREKVAIFEVQKLIGSLWFLKSLVFLLPGSQIYRWNLAAILQFISENKTFVEFFGKNWQKMVWQREDIPVQLSGCGIRTEYYSQRGLSDFLQLL